MLQLLATCVPLLCLSLKKVNGKFPFMEDMFTVENACVNDVLCYVTSARNTLSHDDIVVNTVGFYKDDAIKKAKTVLFQICNETPINRKQCSKEPNPSVSHTKDILLLLEKVERQGTALPDFLASGYKSLPPSSGFESFAAIVCSLRDEIAALRLEVTEVRKCSEKDDRALDNVGCIIQDVAEIKLLVHNLNSSRATRDENITAPQASSQQQAEAPTNSFNTVVSNNVEGLNAQNVAANTGSANRGDRRASVQRGATNNARGGRGGRQPQQQRRPNP